MNTDPGEGQGPRKGPWQRGLAGGRNPGGQPPEAARAQLRSWGGPGVQHGGDTKTQGQADNSGGIAREDLTQPWARHHCEVIYIRAQICPVFMKIENSTPQSQVPNLQTNTELHEALFLFIMMWF